ncbi:hypothetical protein D3C86_1797420 [compost metagenome]
MVGHGGDQDAPDDRPGAAEAGGEQQGEQLRLVADFGEGDEAGGDEQRLQGFHQGFHRGRVDNDMTRTACPPRVGL